MSTKVANVIAVELGILIGIMAWLAFSTFSRDKGPPIAEEQPRIEGDFATIAPVLKPGIQRHYAAGYRAGRVAEQQVEEQQAQTMQYDQPIAPAPYASSGVDDGFISESAPYYAGVPQQPVLTSPDCLVTPFTPFVVYPQISQIIIVSNHRSFVRRPRVTPRFARPRMPVVQRRSGGGGFGGGRTTVAPRRPGGGESQVGNGGVVTRRNPNPRSSRSSQGFKPLNSLARK